MDLRTEYIHYWRRELSNIKPTPITIKITDERYHHHYTQYFIMEKEELKTYRSCRIPMRDSYEMSVSRTKDGYYHGMIKENGTKVWDEMIHQDKVDGFAAVVYSKRWADSSGNVKVHTESTALFKF